MHGREMGNRGYPGEPAAHASPAGVPWSLLGVGRAQLPLITMAVILGGHIRVGFEDNLYLRKGVLLKNNAEMVEVAANIIRQQQQELATPAETRQILGIA